MNRLPIASRRLATEQDCLAALLVMESLPKRALEDVDTALAAYWVALDGVAAADLAEAVRRILRGELGHAFMPSPPELRIVVDRARRDAEAPFVKAAATDRIREQIAARRHAEPSEEAKARVAELYDRFCKGWPGQAGVRR